MNKKPIQNAWHEVRGATSEELMREQEQVIKKYGDILTVTHPTSQKHPRMSAENRAAQFAPFAALTGYDSAVAETARYTEEKPELDENRKAEIDQVLQTLSEQGEEQLPILITWFVPDLLKTGGTTCTVRGHVQKLDPEKRMLILTEGERIPIDDILNLTR